MAIAWVRTIKLGCATAQKQTHHSDHRTPGFAKLLDYAYSILMLIAVYDMLESN
jgi:hypothetical protein